jgi:hypothetical protein
MTDEPLYRVPKDIPQAAQATEQKLRQIRENVTVSEKAEAWRVFLTRRAA